MPSAVGHRDLGNGRVLEIYDDGSAASWDIDTGGNLQEWGAGSFSVGSGSSGGNGGVNSDLNKILQDAYAAQEGYNYKKLDADIDASKRSAKTSRANAQLDARTRLQIAEMDAQLARERLAAETEQALRQAGVNLLSLNADLAQTPADYMKAVAMQRGFQGNQFLMPILNALTGAGQLSSFVQGTGTPGVASVAGLISKLTGGELGGDTSMMGPPTDVQAQMNDLADWIIKNPHKTQGLETLTDTENSLLGSLIGSRGADLPSWAQHYARTRNVMGSPLAL